MTAYAGIRSDTTVTTGTADNTVNTGNTGADAGEAPTAALKIPPSIITALDQAQTLGKVRILRTFTFWQANILATDGRIEYGQEILKAEAWLTANPSRSPRKDLARFLHNWIARAGERA